MPFGWAQEPRVDPSPRARRDHGAYRLVPMGHVRRQLTKKAGANILSPSNTCSSSSSSSSSSDAAMKLKNSSIMGGANSGGNPATSSQNSKVTLLHPSSSSTGAATSSMVKGRGSSSNNTSTVSANTTSVWKQRQQTRRLRVVLASTLFLVVLFFFPPPYQHGLFRELQYDDDDRLPPYDLPESICIDDVTKLPPLWQPSALPSSYFASATEEDFDEATFDEYTSSTDDWDDEEQVLMEMSMQNGLKELVDMYLNSSITEKRIRNLKTVAVQSLLDQVYRHHRHLDALTSSNTNLGLWSSSSSSLSLSRSKKEDDTEDAFPTLALDASLQVLKIATQKYLGSTASEFDGSTCSRVPLKLQFLAYTEYLYRLVRNGVEQTQGSSRSGQQKRQEQKSELFYSENDKKNELEELKLVLTNRIQKTFAACEKKSRSSSHRHRSNKKHSHDSSAIGANMEDADSLVMLKDMYGFDHNIILQSSSSTLRESEISEWMTGVISIIDASSLVFSNSRATGGSKTQQETSDSADGIDEGSERNGLSWPYPEHHNHMLVTVFYDFLFQNHQWSNARSRPHKGFKWLKLRETAYLATSVGLQFLTGNGRRGRLTIDEAPWLYKYIRENFYWALAYGNLELLSNFVGVLRLYGCTPSTDIQVRQGLRLLLHWYQEAGESWIQHKEHYQVEGYEMDDIDYIRKAWSALAAVKPRESAYSSESSTQNENDPMEGERLDALYDRELQYFLQQGAEIAAEVESTELVKNKGRLRRNRIRKIQM